MNMSAVSEPHHLTDQELRAEPKQTSAMKDVVPGLSTSANLQTVTKFCLPEQAFAL